MSKSIWRRLLGLLLPVLVLPAVLRVLARSAIAVGGTAPVADANTDLVVLQYNVGGRLFHLRLYVDRLNPAPISTNNQPDFNYQSTGTFLGLQQTSNEDSLQVTVTNFLAPVKRLYDTTVNFSVKNVFHRDSSHVLQEIFPTAGLAAEEGTGGSLTPAVVTPTSADAECFIERILTSRTGHGGRFRASFVGAWPYVLGQPSPVVPNATGNSWERVVAYLTSGDCRIMGHAGGKLLTQFVLHATPSAKLRRSFNFA